MTRLIIIGLLFSSTVIATEEHTDFEVKIKKADVAITVNEESIDYKKDQTFSLKAGDIICFKTGDGRVVIEGSDYKKQLSNNNKSCKILPNESKNKEGDTTEGATSSIISRIFSLFQPAKENSVAGISRSTEEPETFTQAITLQPEQKYIAVENDNWGPLPITLHIITDKSEIIETMVNEEELKTSFIVPSRLLKDGYQLKVVNMLEDVLVDSAISFEK